MSFPSALTNATFFCLRVVVHHHHLMKRYAPAPAIIAPEPHNWREFPSVHEADFGPYCSRSETGNLAFKLGLLLAVAQPKLEVTPAAFFLAQALQSGSPRSLLNPLYKRFSFSTECLHIVTRSPVRAYGFLSESVLRSAPSAGGALCRQRSIPGRQPGAFARHYLPQRNFRICEQTHRLARTAHGHVELRFVSPG
jgi:hypothetical protein